MRCHLQWRSRVMRKKMRMLFLLCTIRRHLSTRGSGASLFPCLHLTVLDLCVKTEPARVGLNMLETLFVRCFLTGQLLGLFT